MNSMVFHKDKETPDERRAREFDFWKGFKARRAGYVITVEETKMFHSGPGYHWWMGYQAGAY